LIPIAILLESIKRLVKELINIEVILFSICFIWNAMSTALLLRAFSKGITAVVEGPLILDLFREVVDLL